jgi:hypothetical protein
VRLHNPYAAPDAKLADPAATPGSPLKAVTIGLLVDIGGSIVATLLLAVVYGIILGASGATQEEIEAATSVSTDSWFFYIGTLIGCAFSALGGYVCARIARQSEHRLGAILAGLSVLIGLLFTFDQYSLLMNAGLAIAGAAAVMLGIRWGYTRNHRVN